MKTRTDSRTALAPLGAVSRLMLLVSAIVVLGGGSPRVATAQPAAEATVYLLHCTPDAPNVDIYINGELRIRNLAYGTATEALKLPAGSYLVEVTEAGTLPAAGVVTSATVELAAGKAYAIATVGLLADIALQTWPFDLAPAADGAGKLKVINASPDAGSLDLAVVAGDVLIAGALFPKGPAAVEVPAGVYDLEARPSEAVAAAVEVPDVTIDEGKSTTVYVLGLVEDSTLDVIRITQALDMASTLTSSGTGSGLDAGSRGLIWSVWLPMVMLALAAGMVIVAGRVRLEANRIRR